MSDDNPLPSKPLGRKSYGSIGHLPGSRRGPGDHGVPDGQGLICTAKARDGHDHIIVQEKLDGSNVAVARVDGALIPLVRRGYVATTSPYPQHRLFAQWVAANLARFDWLPDQHRVCGEWLAQAHGTRYRLTHPPFVAFDVMTGDTRLPYDRFLQLVQPHLTIPHLIHRGGPLSIEDAMSRLGEFGRHGALDPVEGAVWRVERRGEVEFLAKFVRPGKTDGGYLPEISGMEAVWNWQADARTQ